MLRKGVSFLGVLFSLLLISGFAYAEETWWVKGPVVGLGEATIQKLLLTHKGTNPSYLEELFFLELQQKAWEACAELNPQKQVLRPTKWNVVVDPKRNVVISSKKLDQVIPVLFLTDIECKSGENSDEAKMLSSIARKFVEHSAFGSERTPPGFPKPYHSHSPSYYSEYIHETDPTPVGAFEGMPRDVLGYILGKLDLRSMISMASTNKLFYRLVKESVKRTTVVVGPSADETTFTSIFGNDALFRNVRHVRFDRTVVSDLRLLSILPPSLESVEFVNLRTEDRRTAWTADAILTHLDPFRLSMAKEIKFTLTAPGPISQEGINHLLNFRLRKLPSIFTANMNLAQLERAAELPILELHLQADLLNSQNNGVSGWEIISRFPSLRVLDVSQENPGQVSEEAVTKMENLSQLRTLRLQKVQFQDRSFGIVLSKCLDLERLLLKYGVDNSVGVTFDSILNLSGLRDLSIHYYPDLNGEADYFIRYLSQSLGQLKRLAISGAPLEPLLGQVSQMPNLDVFLLNLNRLNASLPPVDTRALIRFFRSRHPSIRVLGLGLGGFSLQDANSLGSISDWPKLQEVNDFTSASGNYFRELNDVWNQMPRRSHLSKDGRNPIFNKGFVNADLE